LELNKNNSINLIVAGVMLDSIYPSESLAAYGIEARTSDLSHKKTSDRRSDRIEECINIANLLKSKSLLLWRQYRLPLARETLRLANAIRQDAQSSGADIGLDGIDAITIGMSRDLGLFQDFDSAVSRRYGKSPRSIELGLRWDGKSNLNGQEFELIPVANQSISSP
jgi:hypothetical protein